MRNKKCSEIFKFPFLKNQIFHDNTRNSHDPWVRTDTPGPGEALFAIRFNGKPQSVKKTYQMSEAEQKNEKVRKNVLGPFWGSSVY